MLNESSKKKSKKPLIIGLLLALLFGGGGFYVTWSGLLFGHAPEAATEAEPQVGELPDIAFVPVDPLVITLGSGTGMRHLRFASQIEVGCENDFRLRVFGSTGTLDWRQEEPNTLLHSPIDGPRRRTGGTTDSGCV